MTMLEAALAYGRAGQEVFPVSLDKIPLVKWKTEGESTTDPGKITEHWTRHPGANIGLRIPRGQCVLDIDNQYQGDETLAALRQAFPFELGKRHRSGRVGGGIHIWCEWPYEDDPDVRGLNQWARQHNVGRVVMKVDPKTKELKPTGAYASGIDILDINHRYSMGPPSLHKESGRPYEWITEPDAPLTKLPPEIVELLRSTQLETVTWVPKERPPIEETGSRPTPIQWYNDSHSWSDVLCPYEWTLYSGDGDEDGSLWRHPDATHPFSASIRYGGLFVFSDRTPIVDTYKYHDKFEVFSILAHDHDKSAAAKDCLTMGAPAPESFAEANAENDAWLQHLKDNHTAAEAARSAVTRPYMPILLKDLMAMSGEFKWLIKNVWTAGSYGQLAGAYKTLKSHFAMLMALSVASGLPFLGVFEVLNPGPVVYMVGEGGVIPWRERMVRLARGMGISDVTEIPLYPVFQVGQIGDPEYQAGLRANLNDFHPVLLVHDPFYSFHGNSSSPSNLHEEGALLNVVSGICEPFGCASVIVNHFNQTGTGHGLSRITFVGGQEQSDSWITLEHRDEPPPDVSMGLFYIRADIGSRQWGGKPINIDWALGTFDEDMCEHVGDPSWKVTQASGAAFKSAGRKVTLDKTKERILEILADNYPTECLKTNVYTLARGNRQTFEKAFDVLAGADMIRVRAAGKSKSCSLGDRYWQTIGTAKPVPASPLAPISPPVVTPPAPSFPVISPLPGLELGNEEVLKSA
jgi:hypothetical protein